VFAPVSLMSADPYFAAWSTNGDQSDGERSRERGR
jgi:hypothetical protein